MKFSPTTKPKKSIKPGDIYQLGRHRVACGDARDQALAAKLVGQDKVSQILTDVPYGINYTASKIGFKQQLSQPKDILNDHIQSDTEYRQFTKEWIAAIKPHLAPKNAIYIFNSDRMIFALRDGMLAAGCKFSQLLIWVKNQSVMGRLDYHVQHELVAVGWLGTHHFYRTSDSSVIAYPKPHKSKLHPTMKPVGLLRRLILNSSAINDVVYDCFLGSGSSLIAAEQTHRICLGIELDEVYAATAIERWENLTRQEARLIR